MKHFSAFFRRMAVFLLICTLLCGACVNVSSTHTKAATRTVRLNTTTKQLVKGQLTTIRVKYALSTDNIVFVMKNNNIASVVSTSNDRCVIKGLSVGKTKLYVSVYQSENSYRILKCNIVVTPAAASVRFRVSSLELELDDTDDLMRVLSVKPKNTAEIPVFKVDDNEVLKVYNDGTIEGLKVGTATVTATITSGRSDTLTIEVIEKEQEKEPEKTKDKVRNEVTTTLSPATRTTSNFNQS